MKDKKKLSRLFQQAGCTLFDLNNKSDRIKVADLPRDVVFDIFPDSKKRCEFLCEIAFQEKATCFSKLLTTFQDDEEEMISIIDGLRKDEKHARNYDCNNPYSTVPDMDDLKAKKQALQDVLIAKAKAVSNTIDTRPPNSMKPD